MISLPWYFYVIATFTTASVFWDVMKAARHVVHKDTDAPGFIVSAAGLFACLHMILVAAS